MPKKKKKEVEETIQITQPVVDKDNLIKNVENIQNNLITIDENGFVLIPDTYPIKSLALISLACNNGNLGKLIATLAVERLKEHPEEIAEFEEILEKHGESKNDKQKSKPVLNALNSWSFGNN